LAGGGLSAGIPAYRASPQHPTPSRVAWKDVAHHDREGWTSRATGSTTRTASDAGEASYAEWLKPAEEIHVNGSSKMRVLELVLVEDEGSRFDGLLTIVPLAGQAPV